MMRSSMLAPRTIRRSWCNHQCRPDVWYGGNDVTIDAGLTYHPAVMIRPSTLVWHTIRRWRCIHRCRLSVPSDDDYVPIIIGTVCQPTVMMDLSTPDRHTIRLWCREHQRRTGIPSGYDDENINASPTYHPPVMKVLAHEVSVPFDGNEGQHHYDKTTQFIQAQVRLSPFNMLTRTYFHLYKPGSPPSVAKVLGKSTSQPRSHD
jgi:hypothetical protein